MHLYGETWCVPAAGVCTVSSGPEGSGAGALRRQHHVVVYPLTPLHQQVRQGGVQRDVVIVSEQHLLRHQSHLDTTNRVRSDGVRGAYRTEDDLSAAAGLLLEAG